jgi:TolA-binding protein
MNHLHRCQHLAFSALLTVLNVCIGSTLLADDLQNAKDWAQKQQAKDVHLSDQQVPHYQGDKVPAPTDIESLLRQKQDKHSDLQDFVTQSQQQRPQMISDSREPMMVRSQNVLAKPLETLQSHLAASIQKSRWPNESLSR